MADHPVEYRIWHPVCNISDLSDSPLAVSLLNTEIVLWHDEKTGIQGLHDQCPHRGAKLSVGKLSHGLLQCAYHGWKFDGTGACRLVPAMPNFQPGQAQHARGVSVQESMGLYWVCLDPAMSKSQQPVDFVAEHQLGLRKINVGPYEVATSAPRVIENFLDMAHFSFVHEGWLGDANHTVIPDYSVETIAKGFKIVNAKVWQPQASVFAKQGAFVTYTYQVTHPFSAVLTKVPDADSGVKPGYEESIAIFIQPVSPELSRVWFRMAVADFDRPESDISRFQETIFLQDKPILESQRPRRLPLQPTAESHVGTDKASAAYRRYLKLSGITFGVYE